jgi:hypothetical protein
MSRGVAQQLEAATAANMPVLPFALSLDIALPMPAPAWSMLRAPHHPFGVGPVDAEAVPAIAAAATMADVDTTASRRFMLSSLTVVCSCSTRLSECLMAR